MMTTRPPRSPRSTTRTAAPRARRAPAARRRTARATALLAGGALALCAGAAAGQSVVAASPDVTIALASSTVVVNDHDAVLDNQMGVVLLEDLGSLPNPTDVIALCITSTGVRYLAFDTTTSLAGGVVASPGDVVRYDGSSYGIVFDASAEGVPAGARTDALALGSTGLLLSFDTTVNLGGVVAADEDLVEWNGSSFTLVFDGSAEGLDTALDIDGAQDLGGGVYLISLDTSGTVGGVVFDDEDVLRFDGGTWSLEVDSSALDTNWAPADLDAVMVPEPDVAPLMVAGTIALAGLALRRRGGAA